MTVLGNEEVLERALFGREDLCTTTGAVWLLRAREGRTDWFEWRDTSVGHLEFSTIGLREAV